MMLLTDMLPLGAPGIYELPATPLRSLTGVRMDVCAFVGVAPRGPARVRPVGDALYVRDFTARTVRRSQAEAIDSWDAYRRLFGGFDGPGLLPYAVSAFFEQGGRRAYVVRIVHDYRSAANSDAVAWGVFAELSNAAPALPVVAAASGADGDGIEVRLSWNVHALELKASTRSRLTFTTGAGLAKGSLLRVRLSDGQQPFVFVDALHTEQTGGETLDVVTLADDLAGDAITADLIDARIEIEGSDGTSQVLDDVALSPDHERFLATLLDDEAALIAADPRWREQRLVPTDVGLSDSYSVTLTGYTADRAAHGRLDGIVAELDGLWLVARNEGSWGNQLAAELSFTTGHLLVEDATASSIGVPADSQVVPGALLRLTLADGSRVLRFADRVLDVYAGDGVTPQLQLELDSVVSSTVADAELVEGLLSIVESLPAGQSADYDRTEQHTRVAFSAEHPRWLGRVLQEESQLLYLDEDAMAMRLALVDAELPVIRTSAFGGGEDRYSDIVHDDFFDDDWVSAEDGAGDGIHALAELRDLGLLVVPDLYSPDPLAEITDIRDTTPTAGPRFEPCVTYIAQDQTVQPDDVTGLRLDPALPGDLEQIISLQQRVVALAHQLRGFIALLDVPPRLRHNQIVRWRSRFNSDFAAAYHPWLHVASTLDERDHMIAVNPSAFAAGIIANQEALFGIPQGPANVLARGVVNVAEVVAPARHDALHPLGINVYLRERDGVRLSAARTLSYRPEYRQLSVRRLITMIQRTLEQQMQWVVFEPNNAALRADLVQLIKGLMRALFELNAFAGATEADSFFVRCDDVLNPRPVVDAGRLLVEVGVAPAEPLEFIVLRIARDGDGMLRVEG